MWAVVPSPRRRRSAADSLSDLTPTLPAVPGSTGSTDTVALRSEGTAPARRDSDDAEADGPGIAALGLAATLAIALAALRGTANAVTDWRQRRQERATELAPLREARLKHQLAGEEAVAKHNLAMQGLGDKAAQKRGKSIPSSQEYGRKAIGGGRGGSGGGKGSGLGGKPAGGTGPGRSKSGLGSSGTGPGGKKNSPKTSTGSGSAGGKGTGSKSPKSPKSLGGSGKNGSSGKNGGGSGIKSPSGGKSPSSKGSSPALERARGRQDRAAARQGAKVQRRADRQAARLENKGKDRDAARDRTGRAKDARQDTKDRIRNARVDAKEARKKKAREDRFEAKQKARKARNKARRKKKETVAAAVANRTTLGQAVAKAARRRLKKRRKNLAPPVLTKVKSKEKKGSKSTAPAGPKVDLTKKPKPAAGSGTTPKVDLTKKPKPGGTGTPPPAAKKPKSGGKKGFGPGRRKPRVKSKKSRGGAAAGTTGPADRRKARRKERAHRASERAKGKNTTTEDTTGPGSGWTFYERPREGRRSAYDSMRDTDPQQQEEWMAEQVFPAGYHSPGREAVTTGARGLPAGTGSASTTITKEAPVGTAPAVQTAMDDGMNPEHATEVTLDDVVDFLDEVVSEAFAAHDECLLLAAQAKELMYALDSLAARLAAKHNIIGRLTAWAMSKLAESMEVLSRKAEEMSVKSLHAAEACETAKTEMDDAYRPLTQATADAGLRTPSARVHNEN
ncbi:hypothetical protein [Streptomyces sp. SYSU K217416]